MGRRPNDLPANWKVCNGKPLKKTDYPHLYGTLGARWDNDKGYQADFFNIPDLRGVFLRGVNDDRNDGYHDPEVSKRIRLKGDTTVSMDDAGSYQKDTVGRHDHYIGQTVANYYDAHDPNNAGWVTPDTNAHHKSRTGLNNDVETRPVNAYVYFIIKIKN